MEENTRCPYEELHVIAGRVVNELERHTMKIVLAESCTSGLVAAALGSIPGVSRFLCGSAVTYRSETKMEWLGIDKSMIALDSAVSESVTDAMARGVLGRTAEADLALAITGHLGPGVAPLIDGTLFVSIHFRNEPGKLHRCSTRLEAGERVNRQTNAARYALEQLLGSLKGIRFP